MKKLFLPLFLVLSFFLVIGFASAVPSVCEGATANFTCADYINESCTFTGNIDCTATSGFVINGFNSVVVDCANYNLTGNYQSDGFDIFASNDVEIKNCNFITWDNATYIGIEANRTKIDKNNMSDLNTAGIMAYDSDGYGDFNNNIINCGSYFGVGGIAMGTSGAGYAGANSIVGNIVSNCTADIWVVSDDNNINLNNLSYALTGVQVVRDNNVINGSRINEVMIAGISLGGMVGGADYNNATNNIIDAYVAGLVVYNSDNNLVDKNAITKTYDIANPQYGIMLTDESDNNNVTRNTISSFNDSSDIDVAILINDSYYTLISQNILNDNNIGIVDVDGNDETITLNNITCTSLSYQLGINQYVEIAMAEDNLLITGNRITGCIFGIQTYYATTLNVSGNTLTNIIFTAIDVEDGDTSQIEKNTISCVFGFDGYGIELFEGVDSTIYKNNVTKCGQAIDLDDEESFVIESNRITDVDASGDAIAVWDSSGNIYNNYIYNATDGFSVYGMHLTNIDVYGPSDISNNTIDLADSGIVIDDTDTWYFDNNNITRTNIVLNLWNANVIATNLRTSSALINVFTAENVTLSDYNISLLPARPFGYSSIGIAFEIEATTGVDSLSEFNITYNPSGVNESSLLIWQYDAGPGWIQLNSAVDAGSNIVYLNGTVLPSSLFVPLQVGNWTPTPGTQANTCDITASLLAFAPWLIILAIVVVLGGIIIYFRGGFSGNAFGDTQSLILGLIIAGITLVIGIMIISGIGGCP
jgi:hypothetical protein